MRRDVSFEFTTQSGVDAPAGFECQLTEAEGQVRTRTR